MVYIAADKHGYQAITFVENFLHSQKVPFKNLGVQNETEDMKLEDMIPEVVSHVKEYEENRGILVCGTGIGVEVGANKFSGIRACLATNEKIAKWSVVKDKCNVLCLVGWGCEQETINKILSAWFTAEYDGSEKRLKMFEVFDTWH